MRAGALARGSSGGVNMYIKGCKGCQRSKGELKSIGGIIKLKGGWVLNHYGAKENNFLGRLVIQTDRHCMELTALTPTELQNLSGNIVSIEKALKDSWQKIFTGDKVERMYVVYFFEDAFKEHCDEHIHIHLIARTRKMIDRKKPWDVAAWDIRCLASKFWFPMEYRIRDENGREINRDKTIALMKQLRLHLRP